MHRMTLTADERGDLEAVIRKRSGSAALARRARCVLLWADGERRVASAQSHQRSIDVEQRIGIVEEDIGIKNVVFHARIQNV